jgi:hypothetical protein
VTWPVLALAFAVLVAAVLRVVLTVGPIGGGSAFRMVAAAIDDDEFQWNRPRRRWWQLWRRRT